QSAGQSIQKGDRAHRKNPLAGSHADLHGFDSWDGTGGVRRRPARLQCGRHRAAPCARATGRLLYLNSDAPLVSLLSKMLLESHLGTNAINPGGLGAKPPGKFKCRLGNAAIWRSSRPSFRLKMAWAEDRALLGSNPSADPGAEMGRGRVRLCPRCLSAG